MDTVNSFLNPLLQKLGHYLPNVVVAIILLVVGWLLIGAVKKGVAKLLNMAHLNERLTKETAQKVDAEGFIASIIYYGLLIFLFLLVLETLQVQGVMDPVLIMFQDLIGIIPNLIAGVIIGGIGYMLAKILGRLVSTVCIPLDALTQRSGLSETTKLSSLLGQIVFIVIFVPSLVAALDALKIKTISEPAKEMLLIFFQAIPHIIAAALILILAYFIGRIIISMLVGLLKNLGTDNLPKTFGLDAVINPSTSLSEVIGKIGFFFLMLFALTIAIGRLGLEEGSAILAGLTVFAANILLGLVIIVIGNYFSLIASRSVAASSGDDYRFLPGLVRAAVMILALFIGLHAMGFANQIVQLAFALLLGALAVAFALAFGLGGREAAGKHLEHLLSKLRKEK